MSYDELTTLYTFSCPERGEAKVALSAFRRLKQLPGASHPSVYSVEFDCACGDPHLGLVSHDELDWSPLGLRAGVFLNLMTARRERVELELADVAARRIQGGEWPWSFFCYPEECPRPVFPSSFVLLAPSERNGAVGIAVRCPVCDQVSVNLVTTAHVDFPFHNDAEIGVIEHIFNRDVERAVEKFAGELASARFDSRRLALE